MFKFHRTLIVAAAVAGLTGIAAAPALAAGPPPASSGVSVNATVAAAESITLSGITSTITFPTVQAGSTSLASNAENYTVSIQGGLTDDGYTLQIEPAQGFLADGTGDQIANSNITVTETGANPGTRTFSGTTPLVIADTTTGPATDTYSENWALAVPASAGAGSYSEPMSYVAMANA